MDPKVLIIEDDPSIVELLKEQLEELGLSAKSANNGIDGLSMAQREQFALVILDLSLPRLGGFEVCKRIREKNPFIPILMLTSRSSEVDRVLGLEAGADDYLTKPFSMAELRARVNALLRRIQAYREFGDHSLAIERSISIGSFEIDLVGHSVSQHGKKLDLTKTEYDLLVKLASSPGRVYTREELLDAIADVDDNSAAELRQFYHACLKYNGAPSAQGTTH